MSKRLFHQTFMNTETEHSQQQQEQVSLFNRPLAKCRNLASRFDAMRIQLSKAQYYDPFQKKEHSEEEYVVVEPPAKRQCSIVSTIVDGVVNGLLYSAATVYEYMWAESPDERYTEKKLNAHKKTSSHRQNKKMRGEGIDYNHHSFFNLTQHDNSGRTHSTIRDTFLRTQKAAFSKNTVKNSNYTTIDSARRVEETWGLVNKNNYDVDFFATLPPTKPPRHVAVQSLGLFGNQFKRAATI
ncbi:hypothetical protein K501DRAFT_331068 [Backusella circina FSU 941]|nr:hypothetical protein K501DRAFT_331068 [Backusella circina FSU 941]